RSPGFNYSRVSWTGITMPQVPIIMPQLGESIAEATVIRLLVNSGDQVHADQEVLEVETSKATTTVNAPCRGTIGQITAQVNEAYPVGATLGFIEVDKAVADELGIDDTPMPTSQESIAPVTPRETAKQKVEPTVRGLPVPVNSAGASYMSPRM